MVLWLVPYLSKGHMSDVNNGPGGDSNSGPILTTGVYSSIIFLTLVLTHN